MNKLEIEKAVKRCLKKGNWIIRADNNGVSVFDEANGFAWQPVGEWTEAPDWNTKPVCGGGLHGQDVNHGGFITKGERLVFCETSGEHVFIEKNKVKVRKARVLLVNELPEGLEIRSSLALWGKIERLPCNMKVCGKFYIGKTLIKELPDDLDCENVMRLILGGKNEKW